MLQPVQFEPMAESFGVKMGVEGEKEFKMP